MQISRHLLLTCAVAACLTPTLVHAADNEAQIRARQALEEKMKQMETQPAPTNPPPVVSKPKAAAAKPKPAQPPVVTVTPQGTTVENQSAPAGQIHVATPSNDAATQQKLEEALRAAQSQPKPAVQQPAQPMQPAKPAVTAAPMAPPVQSQPMQSTRSYISTPSNDEATNQKLEEALRQRMQQTPAESMPPAMATQKPQPPAKPMKPAPAPRTAAAMPAPKPAPTANYAPVPTTSAAHPTLPETPAPTANYAPVPTTTTAHPALPEMPTPAPVANGNQPTAPTMSLPALSGPATGLSAAKQQKLDELLNQYRADQITPQQYHEQRAKILAEP